VDRRESGRRQSIAGQAAVIHPRQLGTEELAAGTPGHSPAPATVCSAPPRSPILYASSPFNGGA
jgi:hypothetical protein